MVAALVGVVFLVGKRVSVIITVLLVIRVNFKLALKILSATW